MPHLSTAAGLERFTTRPFGTGENEYAYLPTSRTQHLGIMSYGLQVQNRMIEIDPKSGEAVWKFSAKSLMRGETDGSSYNTGGLRATHTAGGYTCIDPSSPIFIRGDTMFIPACFVSFNGEALDEKTPLLRSLDAVSTHGSALLQKLGLSTVSM